MRNHLRSLAGTASLACVLGLFLGGCGGSSTPTPGAMPTAEEKAKLEAVGKSAPSEK